MYVCMSVADYKRVSAHHMYVCKCMNMCVCVLPVHAISTFNVLNAEDRCVAAAILTLRPWSPASDLDLN